MAFQPKGFHSLEEYVGLDERSEEKLEFWGGTVWSMSGASPEHNQIVMNLSIQIGSKAQEKGCFAYPSDMRVRVPEYPPYRYPDLSVLCGKPEFADLFGVKMLLNPQLIVEVLSESTEAFDRGDKFSYYKSIESFSEYLLVAQHWPHVSHFVKHGDGFWVNLEYNDLDETVELRSVPCNLPMSAINHDVTFPEQDPKKRGILSH